MDIRTIIEFFGLSCLLGLLGFLVLLAYWGYQADKEQNTAWQKLAQANDLSFQSGNWKSPSIFGYYRGYYLKLSNHKSSKKYSIRITLTKPATNETSLITPKLILERSPSLLNLADSTLSIEGDIEIIAEGREIDFGGWSKTNDVTYLQQIFDLLSDILDFYPHMLNKGGEVIPILEKVALNDNHKLKNVAIQLLVDIGQETTSRLSHQTSTLLCLYCLEHCCAHTVTLTYLKSVTYYGCRSCGQSRDFIDDWAIVVLDSSSTSAVIRRNGKIWVNWLAHQKLFDFKQVEIVNATDEDVERFAVQVGNDMTKSASYYKQMPCAISSECQLSENSVRILRRIFGQVTIETDLSKKVEGETQEFAVNYRVVSAGSLPQFANIEPRKEVTYPHLPAWTREILSLNSGLIIGLVILLYDLSYATSKWRKPEIEIDYLSLFWMLGFGSIFFFSAGILLVKRLLNFRPEWLKSLSILWRVIITLYTIYFFITILVAVLNTT